MISPRDHSFLDYNFRARALMIGQFYDRRVVNGIRDCIARFGEGNMKCEMDGNMRGKVLFINYKANLF